MFSSRCSRPAAPKTSRPRSSGSVPDSSLHINSGEPNSAPGTWYPLNAISEFVLAITSTKGRPRARAALACRCFRRELSPRWTTCPANGHIRNGTIRPGCAGAGTEAHTFENDPASCRMTCYEVRIGSLSEQLIVVGQLPLGEVGGHHLSPGVRGPFASAPLSLAGHHDIVPRSAESVRGSDTAQFRVPLRDRDGTSHRIAELLRRRRPRAAARTAHEIKYPAKAA